MRPTSIFKVIMPFLTPRGILLFYGLIIRWFQVLTSVTVPCSIYLQKNPERWFLSFTPLVQRSPSETRGPTQTPWGKV